MSVVIHNLAPREVAHIVFALHELDAHVNESPSEAEEEMSEDPMIGGGGLQPMSSAEINNLCESLTCASSAAIAERSWKAAAASELKESFPWLGTEDEASGADTVDELGDLYEQWSADTTTAGETAQSEATPRVVPAVEGGVVQSILADVPVRAYVVDYDIDGTEPESLTEIPQISKASSRTEHAVAHASSVDVVPVRVAELIAAIDAPRSATAAAVLPPGTRVAEESARAQLHHDREKLVIEAARGMYTTAGVDEIRVDDDAKLTIGAGGVWVQGWLWVGDEDSQGA